jgi:uncharacterized protein YkwD
MRSGVLTRLRPAVAALAAVAVLPLLLPGGAGAGGSSSRLSLTPLELSTIDSINALRAAYGIVPLRPSPALFGSAMFHDQQMVDRGYFAHSGPGSSFVSRLASFYPQGNHMYYSVGENLLWTLNPMSSQAMIEKWMKSPEHRANLLNPAWRQVAVAALTVSSAPGVFANEPVTVVTVDFGVRR